MASTKETAKLAAREDKPTTQRGRPSNLTPEQRETNRQKALAGQVVKLQKTANDLQRRISDHPGYSLKARALRMKHVPEAAVLAVFDAVAESLAQARTAYVATRKTAPTAAPTRVDVAALVAQSAKPAAVNGAA